MEGGRLLGWIMERRGPCGCSGGGSRTEYV